MTATEFVYLEDCWYDIKPLDILGAPNDQYNPNYYVAIEHKGLTIVLTRISESGEIGNSGSYHYVKASVFANKRTAVKFTGEFAEKMLNIYLFGGTK